MNIRIWSSWLTFTILHWMKTNFKISQFSISLEKTTNFHYMWISWKNNGILKIPFKFQIMEAVISIIYSIPYNGINLNWTATTGNNIIISRGNSITWNFDGNFLELYRLLLASILCWIHLYEILFHAFCISRSINTCTVKTHQ